MTPPALSSHSPFPEEDGPEPQVLAHATSDQRCEGTPELGTGTFRTLLEVLPCTKFDSCSKIQATFTLTPNKEGSEAVEVGYATAHIIDKTIDSENPRKRRKTRMNKLWLEELVLTNSEEELPTIMRTLFGSAGGARNDFRPWTKGLTADRIVYLDMLKIYGDFRGSDLGFLGLQEVHILLNKLSNGYAFEGIMVLWPATPRDVAKDFKGLTRYKQESKLINFYIGVGYQLLLRGEKDIEGSMTVMGITV